jgi:preprotein translocase subunit SecD
MQRRNSRFLIAIIVLALIVVWVDWPGERHIRFSLGPIEIDQEIRVHQGLDLQGGTLVLLEADVPPGEVVTPDALTAAKGIVENRVNGMGVAEPFIQIQGDRRIIVELPGISDPDKAIATFKGTGLLEFIDAGDTYLAPGTVVRTTYGQSEPPEDTVPVSTTASLDGAAPISPPREGGDGDEEKVLTTVMTGKDLKNAEVGFDRLNRAYIQLEFTPEGGKLFADFTARNVGRFLAITMDKAVISSPVIQSAITKPEAIIEGGEGGLVPEEARSIVLQLKYGALPVPLKVVEQRTVGPTLGQDSIQKSIMAGAIGLIVVLLFMLTYYRLPGFLADLALLLYAGLSFAAFKLIPVTLTLPGVAGFLLSIGMAVDANILIFERMKEELRSGRSLGGAIEVGFSRAWTSIRDSNLSTLITCVILFWFGSNFGASMVKGFAVTLFIGVIISMFTAITVTRTLLRFTFDVAGERLRKSKSMLGF